MQICLRAAVITCLAFGAAPAMAADPAAGETLFNKCKACHAITAPDGTRIQKGGKVGPNLYGVIGRQIGAEADYLAKYGASIIAAGADGSLWDQAMLAEYLIDPSAWLNLRTGDPAARSKMTLKLAKGGADVAAYLASVGPAAP